MNKIKIKNINNRKTDLKKHNLKTKKIEVLEKIVFWFIFTALVLTMAFIVVAISIGGFSKTITTKTIWNNIGDLFNCLIGLILLFLPSFMRKKMSMVIPNMLYLFFIIYLFLSIYLGHVVKLYQIIPYYDTFVHTFSGIVLGLISFSVLKIISDSSNFKIRPWFILVFSICFAVTLGVIWEIFEFAVDTFTGSNMQRFQNVKTGDNFIGQVALIDTMRDLIVDTVGAIMAGLMGFIVVKSDKENFDKLTIFIADKHEDNLKDKKKKTTVKNSQKNNQVNNYKLIDPIDKTNKTS